MTVLGGNKAPRILQIDHALIERAIVQEDSKATLSFYINTYSIYRFQDGVAPPPRGMTLQQLEEKVEAQNAAMQAAIDAIDLSKGKFALIFISFKLIISQ